MTVVVRSAVLWFAILLPFICNATGSGQYCKLLCKIVSDSTVLENINREFNFEKDEWTSTVDVSKFIIPMMTDMLEKELPVEKFHQIEKLNEKYVNSKGEILNVIKLQKCGYSAAANFKLFFSKVIAGYTTVCIGYDSHNKNIKNKPRDLFFFSPFLEVLCKIDGENIEILKINVYHN